MIIGNQPKRLAIYFFFDKDGIVDRFVPYFLDDLKKNVTDLLIVSNGEPCAEGQQKLREYGELLIRENKGFDVWAYKEALEHIGWEKLAQYDEIVMLNSTIMGPVFPLKETFDKMNGRDLDFWGLTMYFKQDVDPSGCCHYGYIPDHIQSHFIACRKSLVSSSEFQQYWTDMPEIHSYWEAVGKHEMIFTKYFEDLGYKSGLSVEMEDLREYSSYPLMMCPVKLMKERRCPIFKRRMFFHDPRDFMSQTAGEQSTLLMRYLQEEISYDTDYIWESILSRYNQADIAKNMNLTFILPDVEKRDETPVPGERIALIMYLQYEESIEKYASYAASVPEESDIYVVTDSEKKKLKISRIFGNIKCGSVHVQTLEKTSDVQILLMEMKAVIMQYDIVCMVPDMGGHLCSVMSGNEDRCLENILSGKAFVRNVIAAFEKNPRLGMLVPPIPNHGPYFTNIGKEWRSYYPCVTKLMDELGIDVPVSEDKPPVTALETIFWFRPEAMRPLYEKNWKSDDFRNGEEGFDEELAASIERIYPYAVQQSGFYSGILMSEHQAEAEIENLNYYVREYNTIMMDNGIENYHQYMCEGLKAVFLRKNFLENHVVWLGNEIIWRDNELEMRRKDRENIEKMSLLQILKFWFRNRERRRELLQK